ncbi:tyrosine-type recombinase/integrase [Cellulomonas sp. APG4]|uniref:tyrosine-type recombinase/integrase n=1 Tax=Cellulomonas sp. APG4 TaxID=1538656 RepID=UPI00192A4A87|nr:tyrosine-type recombinase/integrase [Cellulomonas sp. APG4]
MTTNQGWNTAITNYCTSLTAAGRRPATVTLYRHYLRQAAQRLDSGPWDVTTGDLELLLATLDRTPRATRRGGPEQSLAAKKSMRTAIAGFYRWAHRNGHVDVDPTVRLPTVRVPRGRPRPAPESVVAQSLHASDERVRLMVALAVFAGLRAGEISRVSSWDLDGDRLTVHGKGGKDRQVPIGPPELLEAIANADGWLFPNGRGGHLSPNHVSKLMARAMPDGWTAHTLRHRFGTVAYAGTRDLLAVMELLGHSSPDTTRIYVQLPDQHLRNAVAAAAMIGAAGSKVAAA